MDSQLADVGADVIQVSLQAKGPGHAPGLCEV
ncbi:hypothetical protein RCCS2_16154 [Roseobacter sp. CCS2]|nr:hypothetical protein RCCS2_16154 [Roseobacter sp. CCS2]